MLNSDGYKWINQVCRIVKDTPHWELLLRTVLNQNTSPSGQTGLPQNSESMTTVAVRHASPAGIAALITLRQNTIFLLIIYINEIKYNTNYWAQNNIWNCNYKAMLFEYLITVLFCSFILAKCAITYNMSKNINIYITQQFQSINNRQITYSS